jgi:hypothetical protein
MPRESGPCVDREGVTLASGRTAANGNATGRTSIRPRERPGYFYFEVKFHSRMASKLVSLLAGDTRFEPVAPMAAFT